MVAVARPVDDTLDLPWSWPRWWNAPVRCPGIQPLVRDALMVIWREAERDFRERLASLRCQLGRQRDGEVGAFDEVLLLGKEVVQHMRQRRIGGAEAGGEEVLQGAGRPRGLRRRDSWGGGGFGGSGVGDGRMDWCRSGPICLAPAYLIRLDPKVSQLITRLRTGRAV